jgi:predicted nucleotidyltransferase
MTPATHAANAPRAGDPDEATLGAVVATIVQQTRPRPLAVILFGSRARGDHRPTSDADLLLVLPEGTHTRRVAAAVDDFLTFAPLDVDIVATTPARLAAARGDFGSVLHWAQEQGMVLYQADEEGGMHSEADSMETSA